MLPLPKRKAVEAKGKQTVTAPAPCDAYSVYYGLNWASFVSPDPFEITAVVATAASSGGRMPAKQTSEQRTTHEKSEPAAAQDSAALVAAQLPRRATLTSSFALQRAFPATETLQRPANKSLTSEACYVATLWCLHFTTTYHVTLTPLLSDKKVCGREERAGFASAEAIRVSFTTPGFSAPLDLREEAPHLIERGALLFHPEFVQCITAQGASKFLFYLPPNLLDAKTALPFMHAFWYHGLFTLPESVPLSPTDTLLFFVLPNGDERYVIDFDAGAPPSIKSPLLKENSVTPLTASASESMRDTLFPWRGHSRVRRVIKSGTYSVVVRDDAKGVMASLQRAYDYHTVRHESTWLDPVFIHLMGSCCGGEAGGKTMRKEYRTDTYGARLVCVELMDEIAGEVVAGCCGMAIGSVYHDYTMYTLRQCKDSLGTFLTKLIGEALQRCGYALWYWGFRVDYMADYEKHFGAMNMSREEFYKRWCAARDVAPACAVEAFLREGKGMVPYTAKEV